MAQGHELRSPRCRGDQFIWWPLISVDQYGTACTTPFLEYWSTPDNGAKNKCTKIPVKPEKFQFFKEKS